MKKTQSELQLQAQCFQFTWNYYPQTRYGVWHVTNEMKPYPNEDEQAFRIRIAKAKAAGLVPGVADLHFLWENRLHVFELKVGYNKLSDAQVKFRIRTLTHGGFFYEIRTFEEFKIAFLTIINSKS